MMKGTHIVKLLLTSILLVILFGVTFPALADYLGPDRTRTESYVDTYDWGVWAKPDPTGNSCNHTYGTDCVVCTWERNPGSPCGDATYWYKVGTRSEVVERTVTYPEATINGILNGCNLRNGWCVTSPILSLSASEPVAGYAITLIEGTRNGETFACQGASCDVPLLEGENTFTFWALSSWGDSSRMGSLTARVDTQPPHVNGELSGTLGENGWYVSPVTVSASASDPQPGSGLQALTYTLNGGAWQSYAAPFTLSDGVHSVTFRAQDAAGHIAEASASVQVDTQLPALQTALAGEQANEWYLSRAVFTASAADGLSGLARVEYALDGSGWQTYSVPLAIGDGQHTLRTRAFDQAGNVSEAAPLTFQVDGTPPRIQLPESWYIWEDGELKVSDGQSGLSSVEIEIRDPQGRWEKVHRVYDTNGQPFSTNLIWDRRFGDGTLAPIGTYQVVVKAFDFAGNFTQETAHIVIPAPHVTPIPPVWTNTPKPPPSGSGQGGSGGFVLPTATFTQTAFFLPTPTDTPHRTPDASHLTPNLVETARVMIFGTSTPTPTPKPKPIGGAGKAGLGFPWWLLAAGGAAAYGVSKRKQIAQGFNGYWAKIRERKGVEEQAALTLTDGTAQSSDRMEKGVGAVQNANAWIAEDKVIEPELRRLQVLNSLNRVDYWRHLPGGMAQDLTLIEGIGPKVQRVLNDNGYHTIADLATADPAQLRRLLQEQKWHFMNPDTWVHQARLAAIDDQKGLQALQSELQGGRGPLPPGAKENLIQRLVELEEIAEQQRFSSKVLKDVDGVSDVLSIGGNLVYAATGWEAAKKTGEFGDALGIFGGIRQIAKCGKFFGKSIQSFGKAGPVGKGITFLGKVTGVLSIVTGVFGLVSGIRKISNSLADGKRDTETLVGALDALAGFSATVGGVMLLIPGLQPIAGIALGVSAVLSGASVVAENWGWIRSQLQNTAQVWRDNFRQAGQIVQKVNRIIREGAAKTVERGGQALAQGIERAGERLAGAVNRAAEKAAQGVERGAQAAGRIVQAVSQTISRGIETVGHAAAQGMRQVTQAAAQAVNGAGQALARGSEHVASVVASWARPFSPGLANGIERAGQGVARVVTNVTQRVSSTITQAGQRVSGAIQRGTQAAASAVRQVGQSVASRIVRGGQSVANAVRQVGQRVSGGVRAAAQGVSSTVKSWTSSIGRWLRRP